MENSYNYDEFSTESYDFKTETGPAVGQKAPDFTLTTTDGTQQNLLAFEGDFLVLEMGSITCPLFQSRRGIMTPLEEEFPNVSAAVLYVREAHPGTEIPAHTDFAEKSACAQRLKSQGERRTVFIDDFDGRAHQAYGAMPNAVFIINRHGCVVFQSDWNNPSATRKALGQLQRGAKITATSYFRPALPTVVFRTLGRAGKGSARDFLKGLPYLFWENIIQRNLRLMLRKPPQFSEHTRC